MGRFTVFGIRTIEMWQQGLKERPIAIWDALEVDCCKCESGQYEGPRKVNACEMITSVCDDQVVDSLECIGRRKVDVFVDRIVGYDYSARLCHPFELENFSGDQDPERSAIL